jgi:predicted nucleotidyltransferase component of viral defense system
MIAEAEIRRQAARWGVDPMVADLDYSLGWCLAALQQTGALAQRLRFKGGTCLRKCYFAGYRFSEDLDFTATAHLAPESLLDRVATAAHWSREHDGPDLAAGVPRLEVVDDEYGGETYQVRVYCRGPLRWGGEPRAIRLDVTRDERLLLPPEPRRLIHAYSDAAALGDTEIDCYPLAEILAEKIRAIGGQRRFAISRDLYDIHRLVQAGVPVSSVVPLLWPKFAARGLDLAALDADRLRARRAEFERDWNRRLSYLVPEAGPASFDAAWQSTLALVEIAQDALKGRPS